MGCLQYGLLRAPFSLHLGWIVVASLVNTNVQADAAKSSPEALLALAIMSYAAVAIAVTVFSLIAPSPDAIVCFVAAWAFAGINNELGDPANLDDSARFNPYRWDRVTLGGLQCAAVPIVVLSIGFGLLAIARIFWRLYAAPEGHAEQTIDGTV